MIIFQRGFKLQSRHKYALKSIKGVITQKVIKQELSFLYATHRHNLFYITVKDHQNIPKVIQVTERTRKCLWTDGQTDGRMDPRLIAISPEPIGRGIKRVRGGDYVYAKYMGGIMSTYTKIGRGDYVREGCCCCC